MCRFLITVAALVFTPLFCFGQVPFPQLLQPMATFSLETKDWGIDATTSPKQAAHNPTPITIPGARVIKTLELKALVEINKKIIVVDVLDDTSRSSIPGAVWLPGAGDGRLFGAEKNRLAAALDKLTNGDKARPLVFLCVSSECWLSYNASLYAVEAGFRDVIWYRGGTKAWTSSSLEVMKPLTW